MWCRILFRRWHPLPSSRPDGSRIHLLRLYTAYSGVFVASPIANTRCLATSPASPTPTRSGCGGARAHPALAAVCRPCSGLLTWDRCLATVLILPTTRPRGCASLAPESGTPWTARCSTAARSGGETRTGTGPHRAGRTPARTAAAPV